MTSKTLPPHGSLSRRKHHGCKCWDCCEALRAYNRDRYARQQAGTWKPFVDAEPVRQHLLALADAGITPSRVTQLTNLPRRTVDGFLRHQGTKARRRSTTQEVADKILAIRPDPAQAALVNSTGTHRRLQALSAVGWPMQQLSVRIGLNAKYMTEFLMKERILHSTAASVASVYDELRDRKPERAGVSKASVKRARLRAATFRWAPPKYWDRFPGAIDDPHFTPEYGLSKADLLAEEAGFLVTVAGLSRAEAAARLGKDKSYVDRVLSQRSVAAAA